MHVCALICAVYGTMLLMLLVFGEGNLTAESIKWNSVLLRSANINQLKLSNHTFLAVMLILYVCD